MSGVLVFGLNYKVDHGFQKCEIRDQLFEPRAWKTLLKVSKHVGSSPIGGKMRKRNKIEETRLLENEDFLKSRPHNFKATHK